MIKRGRQVPERGNWNEGRFETETSQNDQINEKHNNLNQNRSDQFNNKNIPSLTVQFPQNNNQFDLKKDEINPRDDEYMPNISPLEDIQFLQNPQLQEYKKALEKYEMFIKNYQKEINELKTENKLMYDQDENLKEKNKELESEKIQLSTQIKEFCYPHALNQNITSSKTTNLLLVWMKILDLLKTQLMFCLI